MDYILSTMSKPYVAILDGFTSVFAKFIPENIRSE